VIPAAFAYERAGSVDQAIELLGRYGEEAKVMAGGHSLLPLMRLRFAQPSVLVDIDRIAELEYVREADHYVEVGALTRISAIARDPIVLASNPLVSYAASLVGDPQVRHRATIGGAIAHGDPAGDPPAVALTLDAQMLIHGAKGERVVDAVDFFTGPFETAMGDADLLTALRFPKLPPGTGWSYIKFRRRAIDWAIVGVAAVIEHDGDRISGARIGLTNMGLTPLRASAVEDALKGVGLTSEGLKQAVELAADGTSPPSDSNGSAEYRRHLSRVLSRRAVEEALTR
jgi:aerobic carbon-monoxide dehydrogenase medium subunit